MKSFFASLLVVAAASAGALAQFTINTPVPAVQCQPVLLQWSGGTPPYFLSVLPGNQPSAPALLDLGTQTGTSLTWKVNFAAGTSLGLTLRDSTGQIAQSGAFDVQPSSDSSCVGQNPTTSAGSTTSGTSTGTSTGTGTTRTSTGTTSVTTTPTTRPTTTPITTPTTTPSGTSTKPSGTTSAPPSNSSTAAAGKNIAQVGMAALIGAAVAAIVA